MKRKQGGKRRETQEGKGGTLISKHNNGNIRGSRVVEERKNKGEYSLRQRHRRVRVVVLFLRMSPAPR